MQLYGIGDLHISTKPYYVEGFNKFISWLSALNLGKREETEIFLVGDIFNSINITADTAAMFKRLVEVLDIKASAIYDIMGNHDYGIASYSVESTKQLLESYGIEVIDEPKIIKTKNGFDVICLPWTQANLSHTKKFVEQIDLTKHYDAIATHWYITKPKFVNGTVDVDIPSNLNVTSYFAGHIHNTREDDKYLGSILPNSCDDDKYASCSVIKCVSINGETKERRITIPPFVKFVDIDLDKESFIDNGDWYIVHYSNKSIQKLKSIKDVSRIYKIVAKVSEEEEQANFDVTIKNVLDKKYFAFEYLNSKKPTMSKDVYDYCTQKIS